MFGVVLVSFLLGAVVIIVAEALFLYHLLNRFLQKSSQNRSSSDYQAGFCSRSAPHDNDLDHHQSLLSLYQKEGVVWLLEPEKVPKTRSEDKVPKEEKTKKEILEVSPVKKRAKIKDHSLVLKDSDGFQTTIHLVGCTISSVSASDLATRKWAKRYPIKIESSNSVIYKGSRICYIYLENSWEKESWCKALRLASSADKERGNWFAKLSIEFHDYLTALNAGYPSFMKPSTGLLSEPTDKATRLDGSSKVRLFLKKFTKKAPKCGVENKAGGSSSSVREERKIGEKSRSSLDLLSASGSSRLSSRETTASGRLDDENVSALPSSLTYSGSQSQASVNSDADYDDKFAIDEGTLCWNLLLSRLFFDVKKNTTVKSSIQSRIQRTLTNMRTPSYIGEVTCTGLNVGILPPYIHSMRVLPMDMKDVWALEMDIEYSGGAILDIATRIAVREPEFEKGIASTNLDSSSVEEATSDLLDGFESFGNKLKLARHNVDEMEKKGEGDTKLEGMKKSSSWKSPYMSRWKSIVNSIANQVSQVPISLAIGITSVRGTLRLQIKPPPSDQLWFSFTSMPEIEFNLDSSVGDHKITNGHVALLLENRFKEAVRDTMVLPNCEYVNIPWMLAEKDDWAPRKVAPFIWIQRDATSDPGEVPSSKPDEAKNKHETAKDSKQVSDRNLDDKREKTKDVASVEQKTREGPVELVSSSQPSLALPSCSSRQCNGVDSLKDLKVPLLNDSHDNNTSMSIISSPEHQPGYGSDSFREKQILIGEDATPKKTGRKARMMDLGKKMGEKLEERRRHLEEKSRNIVEKIRGPGQQ